MPRSSSPLFFLLFFSALGVRAQAQELEVHVINVDQGLSVYVQGPTGTRLLIDGGNPGDGNAIVKPYLQSLGVSDLDYSINTHWHTDHMGGLDEVFNGGFKPNLAAYDRGDVNKPSNGEVTGYMSAVSGVRQIPTIGQMIDLGGGATAQITSLNGEYIGGSVSVSGSSQEENSRSMSIVIRYGDFDCWIGGDLTGNGDGMTANVEGPASAAVGQCEMVVSAHHGSNTSSIGSAVANLSPSFVVHSTGHDNPYFHPTKSTVNTWNTLSNTRVQWCTTDGDTGNGAGSFTAAMGHITLSSDGTTFQVGRSSGPETLEFTTFEHPGTPPVSGLVKLSEFLVDPVASSDIYGEWFEIVNVSAGALDLAGMKVTSGAQTFTIASRILLDPAARFVLGVDGQPARNGNLFLGLGAPWENFGLANSASTLTLKTSTNATIESVSWGGGGIVIAPGKSAEREDLTLPAISSNFSDALNPWSGGDLGTPWEVNDNEVPACPGPTSYCTAKQTSIGTYPTMVSSGTPSEVDNDFVIYVNDGVPNKTCIAFWGVQSAALPFMGGFLCVQPPVNRFAPVQIDSIGDASYSIPIDATMGGTTRYYQFWMRDPQNPDGTFVALSDALQVDFCDTPPPPPAQGAVIVTEIHKDPGAVSDSLGEWIEVYNTTAQAIDLEGWTLRDDGIDAHVIVNGGSGLMIQAGGRLVLGVNGNTSTNGGVTVHYVWSSYFLANGADEVVLEMPGGIEVDRVEYLDGAGWPDTSGKSLSLTSSVLEYLGNDIASNWCHGTTSFGLGDEGTPGAANDSCP